MYCCQWGGPTIELGQQHAILIIIGLWGGGTPTPPPLWDSPPGIRKRIKTGKHTITHTASLQHSLSPFPNIVCYAGKNLPSIICTFE
jgi:hypothetical protein